MQHKFKPKYIWVSRLYNYILWYHYKQSIWITVRYSYSSGVQILNRNIRYFSRVALKWNETYGDNTKEIKWIHREMLQHANVRFMKHIELVNRI